MTQLITHGRASVAKMAPMAFRVLPEKMVLLHTLGLLIQIMLMVAGCTKHPRKTLNTSVSLPIRQHLLNPQILQIMYGVGSEGRTEMMVRMARMVRMEKTV